MKSFKKIACVLMIVALVFTTNVSATKHTAKLLIDPPWAGQM